MSLTPSFMKAILSMDSYNRSYDEGIKGIGSQIGTATVYKDSSSILDEQENRLDDDIGFYAVAYSYGSQTIISYRGTDEYVLDPLHGWIVGAGVETAAQSEMAFKFYREVADQLATSENSNPYFANISLTGHSLGGGLAALVAATYHKQATIFDSMAYEDASEDLYDDEFWRHFMDLPRNEFQEAVYGPEEDPPAPDFSGIYSTELNGQILNFGLTHMVAADMDESLELGDEISGIGPLDLHDMSALVIRMFADEVEVTSSTWEKSAQYFWPVLYDGEFAAAIGMSANGGRYEADQAMRSMLAYSAIDGNEEGSVTIFGDTGIRALYDDANQLGALLTDPDVSTSITSFATDISRVFVQYAAHLAQNKVLNSSVSSAKDGVLDIQSGMLTLDFSDNKWMMGGNALPPMVARQMLMENLSTTVSSSALMTAIAHAYGVNGLDVVEKVSFVIQENGGVYTLVSADDADKAHMFVSEKHNWITNGDDEITGSAGRDVILAGDDDDTVWGGDGNDVVDGGVGDDTLDGGEGNDALIGGEGLDILIGGDDDDILYADSSMSVFREETYNGGDGYDILDFKALTTGLSLTADDGTITITEYGGTEGDVRSGVEIIDIEGFNLTDKEDSLTITSATTGFKISTHGGNDEISIAGDGNEVSAGAGSDEAEISGDENVLYGESGDDLIYVTGTENVVHGQDGKDKITVSNNDNDIYGGADNDTIVVTQTASRTLVDAGSGDDVLEIYGHSSDVDGGEGRDNIKAYGTFNTIAGGSGDDLISVSGLANLIHAGEGADVIRVAGNGNIIYTESGADKVDVSGLLFSQGEALLADASAEDRIKAFGFSLSGGIKNISSESPWVYTGLVKYSVNAIGDLVIAGVVGDSKLYVSGFNNSLTGPFTANIMLGTYMGGAYNIFHKNADAPYGITLRDTIDNLPQTIKAFAHGANVEWDPIVLDLNGDGVHTVPVSSVSPFYDLNGDGFAERAGWVSREDGFLAIDANSDGKITADEFFGSATVSGFAALAALDGNEDGVISASDTAFTDLVVWQDIDGDGVTDAGELKTLDQLGIKSINVTPDSSTPTTQSGNTLAAAGTFTWDDDTTGATAEVLFNRAPYFSKWLEDVSISVEAEALPDLQGHGTIAGLRLAMSYDEGLIDVVEEVLPELETNSLETLRAEIMPLLEAWMEAIPVPAGTPGTTPRANIAILATIDPLSGAQIDDYAIRVTDGEGTYWILASGNDVLDEYEEVIERPAFVDVLAQDGWTSLSGTVIQFFERWTGLNIPLGMEGGETGQTAINAAKDMLTSFWAELNTMAVRLAIQGPLAEIFEGIAFEAEKDVFTATTDDQLVPLFENLMEESASLSAFEAWMPLVNVFLNDFERPDGVKISYAWMYQNIVAAYENVEPAGYTLNQAAIALGVPSGKLVSEGTEESDIFYVTDETTGTLDGGEGADSYVFGRDSGQQVIDDEDSSTGDDDTDSIRFAHLKPEDVTLTREGNDLIISVNGSEDEVLVVDQFMYRMPSLFGGYLNSAHGVAEIVFADGTVWSRVDIAVQSSHAAETNDTVIGTGQIDYLDGGVGDDKLTGGNDGDIYVFGYGYGYDQIADATPSKIGTTNTNDASYSLLLSNPDVLYFKDVDLEDAIFSRVGASNDLTISLAGTDDSVKIYNQFSASYTGVFGIEWFDRIEAFVFADGNSLEWSDLFTKMVAEAKTEGNDAIYGFSWQDTLDGGAGDDYLSGGNETDTYIFGFGYGDDVVEDALVDVASNQNDRVLFNDDVNPENVALSRTGKSNDLMITLDDESTLTIKDQFQLFSAPGIGLFSTGRIETFEFQDANNTVWTYEYIMQTLLEQAETEGNDTIYGFRREDTLYGGAGDDYLSGGGEGDTYFFGRGDGHDVIFDDNLEGSSFGSNIDRLILGADIETADIRVERGTGVDDFILRIIDTNETVTLVDQAKQYVSGPNFRAEIEEIVFSYDDTIWTTNDLQEMYLSSAGTSGNDNIIAFTRDDTLEGGAGNDRLEGRGGGDTYIFAAGHGQDVIYDFIEYVTWDQDDTIIFDGIEATEAIFSKSGQHLVISYTSGADSITVEKFFSSLDYYRIEWFVFDDATLTDTDVMTLVYGTTPIVGTESAETLSGNAGDNTIYGLGGNDTLRGYDGSDILDGGDGNDLLLGGNDNDVYIASSGHDVIEETGGNDEILFGVGITAEDLTLSHVYVNFYTEHLLITWGEDNSILVDNHYDGSVSGRNLETIRFVDDSTINLLTIQPVSRGTSGDDHLVGVAYSLFNRDDIMFGYEGNDTLEGGFGNDTLDGGLGNDRLEGEAGNDLYIFNGGHDWVRDSSGENDVIHVDGEWTASEAIFYRDLAHVQPTRDILMKLDDDNTIVIDDFLWLSDYRIESVTFSDSSSVNLSTVRILTYGTEGNDSVSGISVTAYEDDLIYGYGGDDSLGGSDGNDTLYGGSGNDILNGGADDDLLFGEDGNDSIVGGSGNDVLDGGAGNDTLKGNAGNDLYIYQSGLDYIEDTSGADTLLITGGVTINDISTAKVGNDGVIYINSGVDEITIYRQNYSSSSYRIETVQFDDGFVADLTTHLNWTWGTSGSDAITGTSSNDTIIAKDGNDTLSGGSGADNIHGGSGSDIIRGGDGSDLLHGGIGDDILYGDAGADTIFGGLGADTFRFEAATAYSAIDIVKDFNVAEGDVIDLTDVLDGIYDPMSDVLADFVQFSQNGNDTAISIDRDGEGTTYGWTQIAVLHSVVHTDVDALVLSNNLLVA